MFNFNTAIHMPTHRPTSQWPTQKSVTKNVFFCKKNAVGHATFAPAQEKKVPMVQIYIYVFLKISDLESL